MRTTARQKEGLALLADVKHVEDSRPPRVRFARKPGKSEYGRVEWWTRIFETNEMLKGRRKYTDTALRDAFFLEWPDEDPDFFKTQGTVNYHRNYYNQGRFAPKVNGKYVPPEIQSSRYGVNGEAVKGRSGAPFD